MAENKKEYIRIAANKKAYHNYSVLEDYEAGLELLGPEVKSLREKNVNLEGSFVKIEDEQAFVHNLHIQPYKFNTLAAIEPTRTRRLLLKKREIKKLLGKTKIKGFSLIVLEVYFKGGWAKLKLGLCKGKKLHDKREDLKKKDVKRQLEKDFKNKYKV